MTAIVLRADARELPMPDASVDLIVTSPPYYGLRSYTDGGEHYAGQIGSEATPAEWLQAMLDCTREWMRVVKPTGSLWVNLGDKYAYGHGGRSTEGDGDTIRVHRDRPAAEHWTGENGHPSRSRAVIVPGFRPKSLMLMPQRYAISCVDDLGLILRAEVIWSKPNGLPESVTDRVRRSHEHWLHFTMRPRYFSAVDEIREPSNLDNLRPGDLAGQVSAKDQVRRRSRNGSIGHIGKPLAFNPLGKLPGSVWEIASEPLSVPAEIGVDHFAAFPTEWPLRIIRGWSPSGICSACREPRQPTYARDFAIQSDCTPDTAFKQDKHYAGNNWHDKPRGTSSVQRSGEACACPEPTAATTSSVVLDPFGGTGTTALVAHALGRIGISVDRSADYCRIARWRTTDPAQIAKAMRVSAPPQQVSGQASLFDEAVPA